MVLACLTAANKVGDVLVQVWPEYHLPSSPLGPFYSLMTGVESLERCPPEVPWNEQALSTQY